MAPRFCERCCFLLLWLSVAGLDSANGDIGYELMETRFEFLYKKISELAVLVNNKSETLKEQMNEKLTEIADQNRKIMQKVDNATSQIISSLSTQSCYGMVLDGNGVHQLQLNNRSIPVAVICETESADGGWIVIQQRLDGSTSFNRSWAEYRDGFGMVGKSKEHWLGLENLHQITGEGDYELLVELRDRDGKYLFARYSEFVVAAGSEKYQLKRLEDHQGTADDVSGSPVPEMFSTYDSDNDRYSGNCAAERGGGWWFWNCDKFDGNPNGQFVSNSYGNGIDWNEDLRGLKYIRMSIRAKRD